MNSENLKKNNTSICRVCRKETDKLFKHHVIPRVKGGKGGEIAYCCDLCSRQIHMLFSEGELSKMSFIDLLKTPQMQKFIAWARKHNGKYKMRMSTRVKRRRRK